LGICFAHPNFTFSFWAELQMFVVLVKDVVLPLGNFLLFISPNAIVNKKEEN
jgi:hypothetical protein